MTDKAPKWPEDFEDKPHYEYRMGKKEKILICAMVGFAILAFYEYSQLQNALKTTDWTLDPNTDWTCKKLTDFQRMMTGAFNATHTPFPVQLKQNIQAKQQDLGCQ